MTFPCITCGKEFPTHMKMIGHMGGKHGSVSWGRKAKGYIEHGTNRGYLAHLRHETERPIKCGPCKAARARYIRSWRSRSKVWK